MIENRLQVVTQERSPKEALVVAVLKGLLVEQGLGRDFMANEGAGEEDSAGIVENEGGRGAGERDRAKFAKSAELHRPAGRQSHMQEHAVSEAVRDFGDQNDGVRLSRTTILDSPCDPLRLEAFARDS